MADRGRATRWRMWKAGLLLAGCFAVAAAAESPAVPDVGSGDATAEYGVAPHPMELEALLDPAGVLARLPAAIDAARAANDEAELTRLHLAHANACRVVADWACQRDAGARAKEAATRAGGQPLQVVRGLIAESRGHIALQDYARGEQLLSEAQLILRTNPSQVLSAEVFLAYSSMCNKIAKYALSVDYADRGLKELSGPVALPTQMRLLRNKATAQAELGDYAGATATLAMARALAARVDDPKLNAEVLLVTARIAHLSGDMRTEIESGRGVLAYATQLDNAQLAGQGHEVLGLAAISSGDGRTAERELGEAQRTYAQFASRRDEVRVLRNLIDLKLQRDADVEAAPLVRRFLAQERALEDIESARASDDLEARLKYAESEISRQRLEDEATMARERERSFARDKQLTTWVTVLAISITVVLAAFVVLQRRSNRRLVQAFAMLRESESQAQELLRLSTGFVYLHDPVGRFLQVNPSTAAALGDAPEALVGRSLVGYLADVGAWVEHVGRIDAEGHAEAVLRLNTVGGERHWRVTSRRMDPRGARAYVVGNAVDVTAQVHQAEALREQSERDPLTGCWNRRVLERFQSEHEVGGWGVIGIDLDHFKRINDTEGHEQGDRVLVAFADFVGARERPIDVLVRSGGDEFLLLLPGAGTEQVESVCARLRAEAGHAPCGFSLGSAVREARESLAETVARADADMYAARARLRQKGLGR